MAKMVDYANRDSAEFQSGQHNGFKTRRGWLSLKTKGR